MRYYVKVRRYRGNVTSVLDIGSLAYCNEVAADYNFRYQTDAAYVEPYDPAKEWKL